MHQELVLVETADCSYQLQAPVRTANRMGSSGHGPQVVQCSGSSPCRMHQSSSCDTGKCASKGVSGNDPVKGHPEVPKHQHSYGEVNTTKRTNLAVDILSEAGRTPSAREYRRSHEIRCVGLLKSHRFVCSWYRLFRVAFTFPKDTSVQNLNEKSI